jgi:uncharacterized protein YecT (DUF1311 family)
MVKHLIAICAIGILTLPASAKSNLEIKRRYSAIFDQCMNTGEAARGISSAMNDCTFAEMELQDKRLNQAYKERMARLNSKQKLGLRNEERRWIKSRKKDCDAVYDSYQGGSIAPLVYGTCMIDTTIARTIWLEKFK